MNVVAGRARARRAGRTLRIGRTRPRATARRNIARRRNHHNTGSSRTWARVFMGLCLTILLAGVVGTVFNRVATSVVEGLWSGLVANPDPTQPPTPGPSGKTRLVEGVDYSFIAHNGAEPVRWTCGKPITIALTGKTPNGASAALDAATQALAAASGLDLVVGRAGSPANITVAYGPLGTTRGNLTLDTDTTLGQGGSSWGTSSGRYAAGAVLIRDDAPLADPSTATGVHVVMHELGHALGLGHAAADTHELMAPTTYPTDGPDLGPGDVFALHKIGCAP